MFSKKISTQELAWPLGGNSDINRLIRQLDLVRLGPNRRFKVCLSCWIKLMDTNVFVWLLYCFQMMMSHIRPGQSLIMYKTFDNYIFWLFKYMYITKFINVFNVILYWIPIPVQKGYEVWHHKRKVFNIYA